MGVGIPSTNIEEEHTPRKFLWQGDRTLEGLLAKRNTESRRDKALCRSVSHWLDKAWWGAEVGTRGITVSVQEESYFASIL